MKGNFKRVDQSKRKQELDERKKLENMLEEIPENLEILTEEAIRLLKKKKPIKLDYDAIKNEIDIESTEIVDTSAEFYFTRTEIKSEPYLQQKINVYKITVSNLLFQMKTAEHAIVKLLEKIDEGAGVDRTFEVLAALQKSKMEIIKHLSAFMIVMENNLKDLRNDFLSKIADGRGKDQIAISESVDVTDVTEIGNIRTRGTKNIINSLRLIADNKKEEIENGENLDFEES